MSPGPGFSDRPTMVRFIAVVLALDQRSVSVDSAGQLLQEHLRVGSDTPAPTPAADATPAPTAGPTPAPTAAPTPSPVHSLAKSWCENTAFDQMQNQGCGLCASSCNNHALTLTAASTVSGSVITAAAGTELVQMSCYNACMNRTPKCKAISFDLDAKTCTLHDDMPVGSVCGGSADLTALTVSAVSGEDPPTCGANPNNAFDTIAVDRIQNCRNQACFINEAEFSTAADIIRLGHGSCHRGEVSPQQPGGMIVIEDKVVMGVPYIDGLTPASPACSATLTTGCWPPATQLTWCSNRCKNNKKCRAFNFGKRFKTCEGTCDFTTASGEYYCQLFGTTALYASIDTNDIREQGCYAYRAGQDTSWSQIAVTSASECLAPYGPDCYVRTTRESTDDDFISRGPGFCTMDSGTEAVRLSKLAPVNRTTTAAPGWELVPFTMSQCQAECEARTGCVGLSHGITSQADRANPSFCILYQACSGASCSSFTPGQSITASSKELLAAQFCADQCGGTYNADWSVDTPAAPCPCLGQGPNSQGWQGDEEDANWKDQSTKKFSCCGTQRPACSTCMAAYSSECLAFARV